MHECRGDCADQVVQAADSDAPERELPMNTGETKTKTNDPISPLIVASF